MVLVLVALFQGLTSCRLKIFSSLEGLSHGELSRDLHCIKEKVESHGAILLVLSLAKSITAG